MATRDDWNALDGGWDGDPEDDYGNVRLTCDWDDGCETWTGKPCDDCNSGNNSIILAGQYRTLDGEWVTVDSIGGLHTPANLSGYRARDYLMSDGYGLDIMQNVLDAYRAYQKQAVSLVRIA